MSLEEGVPSVKRARLILLQEPSDGLVRSQNNGKNSFILGDNDETSFLIGRSEGAGCLVTHVGVSRRHATLNFRMDSVQGATWSVKDLKSFNGLMVNGSAVKPEVSVDLNDQDVISIKDQFSWKYEFPVRACGSSKVEINEKMKATLKEYAREKFEQDQKLQEAAIKQVELTAEKEVLTKRLEEERLNQAKKQEEERLAWEIKLNATKEKITNDQRAEFEAKQAEERAAMEVKQTKAMEKIREAEAKMASEVLEREEKIRNCELEKAKLESRTEELERQLQNVNASAEEHKAAMDKLLSDFSAAAKHREEERKKEVETRRAEEAEKQRMLEELANNKSEIARLREEAKRKKEEAEAEGTAAAKRVKTDFLTQCNSELKCSICDELFIEPLSLDCGHVYCQFCIFQWEKTCAGKADGLTCPNCRQKVTNTTKALQINNLIEAIYSEADPRLKAERQQIIQERKADAEKAEKEAAAAAAVAAAQARNRQRRQPGQQRLPPEMVRAAQQPRQSTSNSHHNNRNHRPPPPAAAAARNRQPPQRPAAAAAANPPRPTAPPPAAAATPAMPQVRPVISNQQLANVNGQMVRLVRIVGPNGYATGPVQPIQVRVVDGRIVPVLNAAGTAPIINMNN